MGTKEEQNEIIGAQRKTSYRLPKSLFIPSTMGHDVTTVTDYDNHKFTFRTATKTPNVPFGKRIVTHSQITVLNKGKNMSQMICSMEVEFPLGPPMGFANKIRKAAKASTMSFFHTVQKTIRKFVELEELQQEEEKEKGDGNDEDCDLNISQDYDSNVSNADDVKPNSGDCVIPPPPSSPSSETTEPIEYVYDLSKITDEPILYRRDRVKTEEALPSSSSSVLFTSNTTGIVRSKSSGYICNDMNGTQQQQDCNITTMNDYDDDDVSTITRTSDTISNNGWSVTRQILQQLKQQQIEKRTRKYSKKIKHA